MAFFGENAPENRGKSAALFQMHFAASFLVMNALRGVESGAFFLMI